MNEELKARIEKLPKWAQDWIGKLERDLAWSDNKVAELFGETPSPVSYMHAKGGAIREDEHPLPARSTVKFTLDNGTELRVRLHHENEVLEVYSGGARYRLATVPTEGVNQVWITTLDI